MPMINLGTKREGKITKETLKMIRIYYEEEFELQPGVSIVFRVYRFGEGSIRFKIYSLAAMDGKVKLHKQFPAIDNTSKLSKVIEIISFCNNMIRKLRDRS